MEAERTRVSVLLLCWNHVHYLEQCVQSLKDQTRQDFEVVFLDNASTDGSADLAERLFSSATIPFRLFRNQRPSGISENLNRLLKESSCELVAPLSTDDWYEETYIETMIGAAELHPESAFIAPNGWAVSEENGDMIPSNAPRLDNEMVGDQFLFEQGFFFWVGICYRRASLVWVGGWDPEQSVEDMDLIFRITQAHPVSQITERLVYYRRSAGSVSLDPLFMAEGRLRFFRKHRAAFRGRWKCIVGEMLRSSAAVAIDQHKISGAAKLLAKSIAVDPLRARSWRTLCYLIRATLRSK